MCRNHTYKLCVWGPLPEWVGTREAIFVVVVSEGPYLRKIGDRVFFSIRTAVPYLERRETRWAPLPNVVGGTSSSLAIVGGGMWISLTWGGWGTLEVPLPKVGGGHVKLSPWNSLAIKISVLYLWTLSQLAHWKISSMFLMLLQITIHSVSNQGVKYFPDILLIRSLLDNLN